MSTALAVIEFAVSESKEAIRLYFKPLRQLMQLRFRRNKEEEELSDSMLEGLAGGHTFYPENIIIREDGVAVILLPARVTISQGPALVTQLAELLERGYRNIVLDLSGVQMIDSLGIGELVEIYTVATNRGASVRLVGLPRRATDILAMKQLDSYRSLEEAVESFRLGDDLS